MMSRFIDAVAERLRRAHRFLTRDIWAFGEPGEGTPNSFLAKQARVAWLLVQKFIEDQLMVRAAALTFATALAIVPAFILLFIIIQSFSLGEGVYSHLEQRLDSVLSRVSERVSVILPGDSAEGATDEVPAPPAATQDWDAPDSQAPASETAPQADPPPEDEDLDDVVIERLIAMVFQGVGQSDATEDGADLVNPVAKLIEFAESGARDAGAAGFMGLLLLLVTVFGLMRNIEKSFASIWGTHRQRSFFRTMSDYLTLILVLPVVLVGVLALTAALASPAVQEQLGPLALAVQSLRFIAIWIVFAGIYAIVPHGNVEFRYAVVGGIVAGTAWVLMSMGYVEFQIGLANYSRFYSAFAQIPLLLMWIYVSWTILLFGAELTYAYQYEKTFALERWARNASFAYKEAVAVRAVTEMAWRFDRGLPPLEAQSAAESWNVPVRVLNDVLAELREAGIAVETAGKPPAYQPARSLNRIALGEVLRAIREAGKEPSALRQEPALKPILDAIDTPGNGIGDATLQDVLLKHVKALPDESGAIPLVDAPANQEPKD